MWNRVDQLAWILIDAALAATLLLTPIALAMVVTRQPSRRCLLARGAIVASLALVPLIGLGSIIPVEFTIPIRPTFPPWKWPAWPGASSGVPVWIMRSLVLVVVAASAWKLAGLVLGVRISSLEVLRYSTNPTPATQTLYQSISFAGSSRPALRVSARVARPVLVGPVHPAILIPSELDRPEAAEPLRLSLLHELVHASRRDPWFRLLGDLAHAAWFVLPPFVWIRAQMRLDQEFLADQQASAGFGPFGTYAASLLDLADPSPRFEPTRDRRPRGLGGPALSLRVLMLVRCPFPVEQHAPTWWRWSLPAILTALTLAASSVTLNDQQLHGHININSNKFQPAHGVFRLARLDLANPPPGPYAIPVKLPPRFDLTMDLWAPSAATLADLRVVGRPLSSSGPDPAVSPRSLEGFRSVQVFLNPDGLQVRVDGRLLTSESNPAPLPDLLTIQSGDRRPILVRNLKLVW